MGLIKNILTGSFIVGSTYATTPRINDFIEKRSFDYVESSAPGFVGLDTGINLKITSEIDRFNLVRFYLESNTQKIPIYSTNGRIQVGNAYYNLSLISSDELNELRPKEKNDLEEFVDIAKELFYKSYEVIK